VKAGDWRQVLVFCKTKRGANRLAEQLVREGVEADAIHGNKSQNARTRALKSFKDGELRVLVATDIAARGLDIEQLPHVVNYDLPHVPEDYVHRIGRTGRAGAAGEAISLVSHDERPLLVAIEKLIGRRIDSQEVTGFSRQDGPQSVGHTPARKAPDTHAHRQGGRPRKPDAHEASRKHPNQPKPHQPKPHHQPNHQPKAHHQAKPHPQGTAQQRRPEQAHPAQVPGYRPLTAHGRAKPVPSLLSGTKRRAA
jgi:ATP-dependent RNA helicase RhlE